MVSTDVSKSIEISVADLNKITVFAGDINVFNILGANSAL
jgi:hypothetical protein